jgi:serine/threonine protein kinase
VYFPGIPYRRSCGTLAYAAPELLLPHSRICYDGELADVWSCGVVLYALLQGLLPFRAPSDTELVRKIHQGEFSMPEGLTPTAQELLRCLLSVDPTKRPRFSELQKHPWLSRERPDDEPAPSRSSAPRTRLARFRGSSFFSRFRDRSLSGNPNSSPHGTTLHANSSPSDRKKKGKESIDSASSARVTQGSSRRESDVAISRKQKRSSSVFRRLISPIVSKLRS